MKFFFHFAQKNAARLLTPAAQWFLIAIYLLK